MLRFVAALALGLFALFPGAALADDSGRAQNVQIADVKGDHGYRPIKTKAYAAIRKDMVDRKVLEEYIAFMSPLRLPKTLWVYAEECDGGAGASPHYDPSQRAIVMCYQFVKMIADMADPLVKAEAQNPKNVPMKVTRTGFIAGVFAGVILHETGHALFDILNVPIFGREEDAADEMSTFVSVQFKPQVADLMVASFADIDLMFSNPPTKAMDPNDPNMPKDPEERCQVDPFCAFADEHGAWGQRFFNTLCIAYGANPAHFQSFAKGGWLPKDRDCVAEYQTVRKAFATTIYPFIDKEQMKKVQAGDWFKPAEMK